MLCFCFILSLPQHMGVFVEGDPQIVAFLSSIGPQKIDRPISLGVDSQLCSTSLFSKTGSVSAGFLMVS